MIGMAIAALTTAALIVKLFDSYHLSAAVGLGWVLLGLVVGGALRRLARARRSR